VAVKYYNTVNTLLDPDGADIDGVNDDQGNVDSLGTFPAFFDAPDPTFSPPTALLQWEQVSATGNNGSLVYIAELKGATTLLNPAVVPYYRDDKCLDDGTGDDPVQRPWPGEASTDLRVRNGYCQAAYGHPCDLLGPESYASLTCDQRQGAWGSHGIHYLVTSDTDNVASPGTLTEIDAQQWQFVVPTAAPANVGAGYGNVVLAPLQTAAIPTGLVPNVPPVAAAQSATTEEDTARRHHAGRHGRRHLRADVRRRHAAGERDAERHHERGVRLGAAEHRHGLCRLHAEHGLLGQRLVHLHGRRRHHDLVARHGQHQRHAALRERHDRRRRAVRHRPRKRDGRVVLLRDLLLRRGRHQLP
jgi:hypothetical protein